MKRLLNIMLLLLAVVVLEAQAGEVVSVPNGFINGHAFMSLPTHNKSVYLMGVVDGMMAGASLGGNEKLGQHIKQCLSVLGGTNQTLLTAVVVFMNTHLD